MRRRGLSVLLWFVAFLLTVTLAYFQRATGPSYPLRGSVQVADSEVRFKLQRSDQGRGELPVRIEVPEDVSTGSLVWRRYPTEDPWQVIPMVRADGVLEARVPTQPPAGKVEYRVDLQTAAGRVTIPQTEAAVARFRGDVPASILIPHILAMFTCMFISTRAFLEVMRSPDAEARALVLIAMVLLIVGGLCLGPMVQKHAFGAYWTGWPYGTDLTDNKTLVAFLAWLPATALALLRARHRRIAVVLGWVVMMAVFLIPHSMRGSEIDWSETDSGDARHAPAPSR